MRLRWTDSLEKQARACLAPLKLPTTLTGLEKAQSRWEKQLGMSELVMDKISLSHPDGCDAPITEGDDGYIDFCWASTQHQVCWENLKKIKARILNLRAQGRIT